MATPTVVLPAIPAPLAWDQPPAAWELAPDHTLHMSAAGDTDLFLDPQELVKKQDAPRLLFTPHPHFTLSARVAVDLQATYDAGVLLLYGTATAWAKLCFELSPHRQPMIVSVVTRGLSDDCNSVVVNQDAVYLRVTRLGQAFAFHYAHDGAFWHLVRYFTLPQPHAVLAGFSAQSPTGSGCRASFSEISYAPGSVRDIRSGE